MALLRSPRRLLQLRDLSPFTKKELRFDKFPRHPGGGYTLAALVGSNVCVWFAWQTAKVKALSGDEQMLSFMGHHFVGSNQDMSKLHNLHRIILASFSHEDLGHLTGNMTALLLLGPRLHEFLGRARFLALYLAGSVGGTLATQWLHLDPAYEARMVEEMPKRYQNLLDNHSPGQALGLGASDAISALFACFYLVFPRQPVPFLWMKANIAWTWLPQSLRTGITTTFPGMAWLGRRTRASAIWVLPMFFFVDFVEVWRRLRGTEVYESGLLPKSNTGHAAHVGGFLAGSLYYGLVAHPLKARYFEFTQKEMLRRAYLMSLSLGFWYFTTTGIKSLWGSKPRLENDGRKVVLVLTYGGEEKEEQAPSKEVQGAVEGAEGPGEDALVSSGVTRALERVWGSDPRMPQLVEEANRCSIREACLRDPRDGRSGDCDGHFVALREYLQSVTTAPRSMATLLGPQFLDSVSVCRTVLREFDPEEYPELQVHGDYRKLSPAINDLEFGVYGGLYAWSRRRDALAFSGLQLKEKKHEDKSKEVRLVGVRAGSPAEKAGACAHIGHAITHVNGTAVSCISDVQKAVRFGSVRLWFEERRKREKSQPRGDAPVVDAPKKQSIHAVDLRRWGWRSEG